MTKRKKTRVVDKWKTKKWYEVKAPSLFEGRSLCEVISSDEKNLLNRIIKRSLAELGISSASQLSNFVNLKFRITEVKGTTAQTALIGHEISPAYIKTFARRGKTLIHEVIGVKTKDEIEVRIKIIAVTDSKVSATTKRNLRSIIIEETKKFAKEVGYDELMQAVIYGKLSSKIFNKLKQITKMRRVEIRKSEKKEVF